MTNRRPPLPDDGIYRAILWVMVLTVIAGAVVALLGETMAQDPAIAELGAWIAIVGGALYVFFRWLGAREARRRGPPGDGPGTEG